MPIKDYKESDIRNKLLGKVKKANSENKKVDGKKHDKLLIYKDGVLFAKVKLPNDHQRPMKHSKSSRIASSLRLNEEDFCKLIDCTLTGQQYYQVIGSKP
jgi:hypothetical protein